jgi:SAM-dependent methyltransferase
LVASAVAANTDAAHTEFGRMGDDSLRWLDRVRAVELDSILAIAHGLEGRVLEIGGGTGSQAAALQRRGVDITSIEMAASNYRHARVFPLIEYDGVHIPFQDETFDTLFSSNVLEHVPHLDTFQMEMMRVLKPKGRAIHVMPSPAWRLWSNVTHYVSLLQKLESAPVSGEPSAGISEPSQGAVSRLVSQLKRAAIPARHGERGNVLTEVFYFRPVWWRKRFEEAGWIVEEVSSVPLFYTGYMVLRDRLDFSLRRKLAAHLGAASTCFILRKPDNAGNRGS